MQAQGYTNLAAEEMALAIIDEMIEMREVGGASFEMAIAFILEKYNVGVSLLKQNPQGDIKKIRTTKGPLDSYGQQTYQSNNCQ